MIDNPKSLNTQQTVLRQALESGFDHEQAIQLCLQQHALLHSAKISSQRIWSWEDEILDDLTEPLFRRIPKNEEHSIAWCIWHLARIEDTAMNLLIAGSHSVFEQSDWPVRLNVPFRDAGNEMQPNEMSQLNAEINLQALRDYRAAVGSRTQAIIAGLSPEDLKKKVAPARIQRVLDMGFIRPESQGITDYWSKRNIAGLLLMPATRHNITHLNESNRLKKKRISE